MGRWSLARPRSAAQHRTMTVIPPGVDILREEECWRLLGEAAVGRLAVDVAGQPDIYPINYVVDDRTIVFRTAEGTKLASSVLLHRVAFEIDGYLPDERVAWSVIIKGWAREVERATERVEVDQLPLFPWVAFPKPHFIRITPTLVTGRRFHVVDDVTPDSSIGWADTEVVAPGVEPRPGADYHPGAPKLRPD